MCRLVAYLGHDVIMEDILVKPSNSLVMQSYHARESEFFTNGDGFGLGWYAPEISANPALFTSILPAWNDQNLLNLTAKIKSSCFFAHVRAASFGGINFYNCHPFVHDEWMLMHNGSIANFPSVKRHLRHLLDDEMYNIIKGETDSEHFFALFLQLAKNKSLNASQAVADNLKETIEVINQLVQDYGKGEASFFNICLTDGKRLFATRYCSDTKITPESLHYFSGHHVSPIPDYITKQENTQHSVLIASEKLTDFNIEWLSVPKNHILIAEKNWEITLKSI